MWKGRNYLRNSIVGIHKCSLLFALVIKLCVTFDPNVCDEEGNERDSWKLNETQIS